MIDARHILLQCFVMALALAGGNSSAADELGRLQHQADSLYDQGDYIEAGRVADEIGSFLENYASKQPTIEHAGAWLRYGRLLLSLSDFARAREVVARAVDEVESVNGRDTLYAEYLSVLATVHRSRGEISAAKALLEQSLAIHESFGVTNQENVSAALVRLASTLLYAHQLRDLDAILDRAYDIRAGRFGEDHPLVATILWLKAEMRTLQGRLDDAEQLYTRSLDILRQHYGPRYPGVARVLVALGVLYQSRQQYERATDAYEQAIRIFDNNPEAIAHSIAVPYNRLGQVYMDQGQYEIADSLFHLSLHVRRQNSGANDLLVAFTEWSFGRLYMRTGRTEEAEEILLSVLERVQQILGPLHPNVIRIESDLAVLYSSQQKWEAGIALYDRILQAQRSVTRAVFAASSERDKLSWIHKYPLVDRSLLTFAFTSQRPDAVERACTMVLTGRGTVVDALAIQSENAYCSLDPAIETTWRRRSEICTRISNIAMGQFPPEWQELVDDTLSSMCRILDSLELALSQACWQLEERLLNDHARARDIRENLRPGEALWEIVRYDPLDLSAPETRQPEARYAAFVLTPQHRVAAVDLGPARVIDSLLTDARQAITEAGNTVYGPMGRYLELRLQTTLRELHCMLVRPLDKVSDSAETIIVAPDGALNLFPLEITLDEHGRYSIESRNFLYVSSGRELLQRDRQPTVTSDALILADPAFDADPKTGSEQAVDIMPVSFSVLKPTSTRGPFVQLPFTRREAETVGRVLEASGQVDVRVFRDQWANESVVRTLSEPPRILHLATHGFVDLGSALTNLDNPLLRAGLALAGANRALVNRPAGPGFDDGYDGILTALEITGLNLHGTEIVTLSGCETGLGNVVTGEGVFGLRRSFSYAGASAILMSLWKVPDPATAELMEGFYRRWSMGNSKSEALRQSMLSLLARARATYGNGHPSVWSGFVLAGTPE